MCALSPSSPLPGEEQFQPLSELGTARGLEVSNAHRFLCIPTSIPTGPCHRPWISVLSSLLGRAARRLRMSQLPLAVAVGTWQSVHKVGRCFAPGCPVSKLLMVIPVCYLLPAARGGGFSLFLQADGDLHLALEVGAFRRRLNTAVSASYLEVFGAEGSGWGTPCHPEVQPHCGWPRPAQGHNLRGHP